MFPQTLFVATLVGLYAASASAQAVDEWPHGRLPDGVTPVLGMWGWSSDVLKEDGYRAPIEMFRDHTDLDVLTVCCRRTDFEATNPAVHDQVKAAAEYARECGMGFAFEVDIRVARTAFMEAYPDELQEMLRLRTVPLKGEGQVSLRIEPESLRDHMNGGATPYYPVSNRLLRVYAYEPGPQGIKAGSMRDITDEFCTAKTTDGQAMEITINCNENMAGRTACVAAAFSLFTPDVFAPHLLEFQEAVVKQYADIDLAGIMKDEWGFPPCFDGCPEKNDFWYSDARAKAYAQRTGGRELLRDCFLMYLGEEGRERERQAAINHFRDMSRLRNAEVEDHFYHLAKKYFGPDAFVVTHPTWMPYPGTAEFKKNGLHWWSATRDLAQTDEGTPFCARTSLAKKWGSPVWINQYYNTEPEAYERNVWSHALGGGRINYHPLYPYNGERYRDLYSSEVMLADARIRLLNLISDSPVDCPVAVIFGHTCAMNWAGPAYDDVGLALTDALWRAGFYADLIPATEIGDAAFRVDENGALQYGTQTYAAVVLYHPEFEDPDTAAFLRGISPAQTALFRVGDWTRDFEANVFDGIAALPSAMVDGKDADTCAKRILDTLQSRGVTPHSPATWQTDWNANLATAAPSRKGAIRLIDGTRIMLSGEDNVAGDPIEAEFTMGEHTARIEGKGVAAVRLDDSGQLEAFVAGGLKHLEAPGVSITLPGALDVAYWHEDGKPKGVVQGDANELPETLTKLTTDWSFVRPPSRMK